MAPSSATPPALALDDPRWSDLEHAYGPAGDIPGRLRALRDAYAARDRRARDATWNELWSALCHQGSVYTASYSAVPHLVAIGAAQPRRKQRRCWPLVGAIALARDRAPMFDEQREAYEQAVRDADHHASRCAKSAADEKEARELLWAVAALRGFRAAARALEGLGDGEIAPECPECSTQLYVTLKDLPFPVTDEDPVGKREGNLTHAQPRAPRAEVSSIAQLARDAGQEALASRLLGLDADVTCPNCNEQFSLLDVAMGDEAEAD